MCFMRPTSCITFLPAAASPVCLSLAFLVTVPDVNLLQGRIFPSVKRSGGCWPLYLKPGLMPFAALTTCWIQKQLARNPHAPYGAEQLYVNLLENLLLVLLGSLLPPAGLQPPVAQPQLEPQADKEVGCRAATFYWPSNVYGNLSLRDICRATSFSKSYLEKRFKQQTGLERYGLITGGLKPMRPSG